MKTIATSCCLLFICLGAFSQTNIHYWNFNAGATITTSMKWPSPVAATTSDNYGSITHAFDNTDNFTGATLDAPGFSSPTAGEAFCVTGSNNNGLSLLINASTLGFRDIEFTYATRGTASGFTTHTIDYTIDGSSYINSTTITGRNATSFSLQTISFVSIAGANNNPNFKIRISLSGATSGSGNNRFDNIRITGTSSPCSPTNQPTSMLLSPSFNYIDGSFTSAAAGAINASAYLLLYSTSAVLNSQPTNGTVYNADDIIGNGIVVSADNSTSFTVNTLMPGTSYYFFAYSYDNSTNCYNLVSPLINTTTTTSPPACTEPASQASGLSASAITGNSMNLFYTRGNGNNVLIVAKTGSPVSQPPFNSVSYPAGSQTGPGNTVIYNGTASSYSYNSLLPNTSYYFALYEYNDAGVCYNAAALTGNFTTACTSPVTVSTLGATAANGQLSLSWTNPATISCYDQVLVVASTTSISGQGGDYTGTANTIYTSGQQVVYRSTGNSVTVTGLTNNTTYYFRVFTRLGALWSPGVELSATAYNPASGYQYLFGNLHAHSSYSDGNKDNTSKTPKDDFEFARDANCMDFLGMSEHNHSGAGMSYPDFLTGYNQAQLVNGVTSPVTGNNIVTLWGMEWGVISSGGHVLVYGFNEKLIGWESSNYDLYVAKNDYSTLWNTINSQSGSFATLAHPNNADYNNLLSAYNATADNAIAGSAIESGPAFSLSTTYNDFPSSLSDLSYFKSLLAKGYHVAPQIDHDNHNMTFGTVNSNRTVVLATTKTQAALMEGLRARRYYASQDCNVRVEFKTGNHPMGSIVTGGGLPSISLLLIDPDGESLNTIELWGAAEGASVPSSPIQTYSNTSNFTFSSGDAANMQPNNSSWYYFTIITQADGNKIVTAPIWYTRSDMVLPVTLLHFKGTWSAGKNEIVLNWLTGREINSRAFVVQRSSDNGITWSDKGTVPAAGHSNNNNQYNFTDKDPQAVNWYRLKTIDMDNAYSYSKIVILIATPGKTPYYSVYPNPAKSAVSISSISPAPQKVWIKLMDNTGRILQQQQVIVSQSSPAKIQLTGFKPSLYYIKMNDTTEKLMIAEN